ncbi:MAG: hypothetical protein ACTHMG_08550 [Sphingomonas sp.]
MNDQRNSDGDSAYQPLHKGAVAPPQPKDLAPDRDAGKDPQITEELKRNPESVQARLDEGLDESMDASDPPASVQPVHRTGPAPSSGYDPDAERERQKD